MRYASLGFAIALVTAPPAHATTCSYAISYIDPTIHGACFIDAVAGCPIHLVMPHAPPPVELAPAVFRNGQLITVSATTALVGTLSPMITTIDYSSCDCHQTTSAMQFDQLAVTLTGALAGDVVSVGGHEIAIGPAGGCPPSTSPIEFDVQLGGCDLCPIDPVQPSSGCSTTTLPGLAVSVLLAIAVARRRRSRARCGLAEQST
jgi:hypothetical protein